MQVIFYAGGGKMSHEKYTPIHGQPIVFTDLETTGFSVDTHEIIEMGVVVTTYDFEIIDEIDLKVMPEHIETASEHALVVNGYDPESWNDAVSLNDAMRLFGAKAIGAALIGHNSRFDLRFIHRAFEQTNIPNTLEGRLVDNIHFAKHVIRNEGLEKFSQHAVAEHLGLEPEPAIHRAINGARLARSIYKSLVERIRY